MDIRFRFEDNATRVVSLRQLSRRTSALLDELAEGGGAFLISRFGRPVALLSPLDDPILDQPLDAEPPFPELDDGQEAAFQDVATSAPHPFLPASAEAGIAFVNVELEGLIVRTYGGYVLTPRGRRRVASRAEKN